jgi:flagellar basal-body rod protein FlgB
MGIDKLLGPTIQGLERLLDLSWRRGQAINANIANAETPQYRAVDLDFGRELDEAFGTKSSALEKTSPLHQDVGGSSNAKLISDLSGATKMDGNNVDLDLQMGRLAYNTLTYTRAAALTQKKLGGLSEKIRQLVA